MNTVDFYQARLQTLSEMWQTAQDEHYDGSTVYQFEFEFEVSQKNMVTKLIQEMDFKVEEFLPTIGGNLTVLLCGEELAGLRRIINFDRAVTKATLLEAASQIRLNEIEAQIKQPKRYAFNKWVKEKLLRSRPSFTIPTEADLEQEVNRMYREAGILLTDDAD